MLYEYFRVLGRHEAVLDFSDVMRVTLRGDDVLGFAKFEEKVFVPTRIVSRIKERRWREKDHLRPARM